eukprot:gene13588-28861_t
MGECKNKKRIKTWERRLNRAKRKHRSYLKNWRKDDFKSKRLSEFLNLKESPNLDNIQFSKALDLNSKYSLKQVDRICSDSLSTQQFQERYEATEIPCIITDIPILEKWRCAECWTFDKLKEYRQRVFKVGEDDDGYSIKIKLKHFLKYLQYNTDDSPLYIFDSHFDDDKISKKLLQDYTIPSYFPDDLFKLVGEKRRPPYRWFLIGPERSGTCVHIDPLGTSAWNTVLQGRKRWVLLPPNTPKRIVKAKDLIRKGEDDEAINYFIDLIPRLRVTYPELNIVEFIQYPGDTVFIPGGWWHAVLNLDDTIAITQ